MKTNYYHQLDNERIQCDLCPNACQLKKGQKGICSVRQCQNGAIVLTAYNHPFGLAVDPIEKKPLYHFLPGSKTLSFGTLGCNLRCQFCQNWHMTKKDFVEQKQETVKPESIAQLALEYGCQSVAFTYNEPIIFMEYAIDVAKACHEIGIQTVAVTNGYICENPRKEFFQYIDAANVDLKAFSDSFYQRVAGGSLQPILNTMKYLRDKTKVLFEITNLIIPGKNDDSDEIDAMTKWIVKNLGNDIPLHFTAFHPAYKMLDVPITSLHTLQKARNIALNNGIYYVYTGNIDDINGGITFCHQCQFPVIERQNFAFLRSNLTTDGKCPNCQTQCAGIFSKTKS